MLGIGPSEIRSSPNGQLPVIPSFHLDLHDESQIRIRLFARVA